MNETMKKRDAGVEIDLQDLLVSYLRRWLLIVLCVVIAAAAAFGYTYFFVTPMYRAEVTLYVNNTRGGEEVEYVTNANLITSQRLVSTYINIIRSDTVLQKVADAAELNVSPAYIRSTMSAAQVETTEIFDVSISHPDPEMAARIANAVAEVAPAEIAGFVDGSSAKIIDYATVPQTPYSPNYTRNVMLGGVVGGVLAVIYITLKFLLNVRIYDSQDLERLFDYPVLGQIPSFDQEAIKSKGYGYGRTPSRNTAAARTAGSAAASGEKK